MKLNTLFKNWSGTISISEKMAVANLLLVVVVLGLVVKMNFEHERIVMVPPHMSERATVSWKGASGNYMESWGLFIAASIGSITPQTATSVADSMGYYFDPAIYPSIRNQIMSIVDDPNFTRSGTINVFTPKVAEWEAATEKVFVHGVLATTAYKNTYQPIGQLSVTYEMIIKVVAGVPKVMKFNSYVGPPRTLRWKQVHQDVIAAEEKKASKERSDTILPQDAAIRNALDEASKKVSDSETTNGVTAAPAPATPAVPAGGPAAEVPTPKEKL